jgi:hypothetical protein
MPKTVALGFTPVSLLSGRNRLGSPDPVAVPARAYFMPNSLLVSSRARGRISKTLLQSSAHTRRQVRLYCNSFAVQRRDAVPSERRIPRELDKGFRLC